jgi:hypothetical protein
MKPELSSEVDRRPMITFQEPRTEQGSEKRDNARPKLVKPVFEVEEELVDLYQNELQN